MATNKIPPEAFQWPLIPHHLGSLNDTDLLLQPRGFTTARGASGFPHLARPIPYYNIWVRLRQAWDVLTYKADAFYWGIDFDKEEQHE